MHEKEVGDIAMEMGFEQVSLSSTIMPMVRIVPRGYTGKSNHCCEFNDVLLKLDLYIAFYEAFMFILQFTYDIKKSKTLYLLSYFCAIKCFFVMILFP